MLRNPGFLSFSCPAVSLSSEEAVTKGKTGPEAVERTGAIWRSVGGSTIPL